MDIYQLKTFVAVAREGSITRASELLHLSQPAVSAHIKAIEDVLGLALFERTPRGMSLTPEGERLVLKAERTLAVHQELMQEATRIKGHLVGPFKLGIGGSSNHHAIGRLLAVLSERAPDVQVVLRHGASREIVAGIRNGAFDAGFYNDSDEPTTDLHTIEVSRFKIYVAASPSVASRSNGLDWNALAELPWIYPTASACCAKAAQSMFAAYGIAPKRIINVDREDMTRTLISGGMGVGLLHEDTAKQAEARGEVSLLSESQATTRVMFAHLVERAHDPLLSAAASIMREVTTAVTYMPTP